MKKTITTVSLILIAFISTSAYILKYNNGIAGYTGSPGEVTCSASGCHGGGSSAASGITITASPSFTNGEYVPGTAYSISVTANATGFTHYGFGCEILSDANTNAGVMQGAGTGVKFLNAGARKNAVHTTPKTGSTAVFSFQWISPDEGSGNATIYAAANAVNNNGSINGDFPITPVSLALTEGASTIDVGVHETAADLASQVSVYPNPSSGSSMLSYTLKQKGTVSAELVDISGRTVKTFFTEVQAAGDHSQQLNLQAVPAGIYFVKTSVNAQKVSQKLITVQ